MIKNVKSKMFGGHLNIEFYTSADALVKDLSERERTDSRFKNNPYEDSRWVGATKDETFDMLHHGYAPVVERLKKAGKVNLSGTKKRVSFFNDVAGFQPVVPLAIMGVPNCMVNSRMTTIKNKVIDVYYDMTVSCSISAKDIIRAGEKMIGALVELEGQGYRFNLYSTQSYYDSDDGTDMLCVRIKSANQPLDIKRMSFCLTHPAFFRGVGFDWYSKVPGGIYRCGYGRSVFYAHNTKEMQPETKKIFGNNSVFFSCAEIISGGKNKDHIKDVLTNSKGM